MIQAARIAANLEEIRQRIGAACRRRSRDPAGITVLGASKSQPVERLRWAWDAGLRVFGENRVQEALLKIPALSPDAEWHLIGPLQSNKVKKAVPLFTAVHSVDRLKIAHALDREGTRLGRRLQGFVEVNLASESTKHGFLPDELLSVAARLAELESLRIVGLMAIPPFEAEPEGSRVWFQRLRDLRDRLCSQHAWSDCPGYLSMGMSHDYDVAVEEGATHVRIGTALFGARDG